MSLPAKEQQELLIAMLRRNGELTDTVVFDDQLVGIADELFQSLDGPRECPISETRCIAKEDGRHQSPLIIVSDDQPTGVVVPAASRRGKVRPQLLAR